MTIAVDTDGLRREIVLEMSELFDAYQEQLYRQLKEDSPVRTGFLRSTIRRGKGDTMVEIDATYASYTNALLPHRGWIDRALEKVTLRFNNPAYARRILGAARAAASRNRSSWVRVLARVFRVPS